MRLRFVPALALIALLFPLSGVGAETQVSVSKIGDRFLVEAASSVAASPAIAWQVLTGYEEYPSFVPNLLLSRRLADTPPQVEQRGDFGVLFFRREVHALLEIEEIPKREIRFRAFGGNMKTLNTQVVISAVDNGALVRYRSEMEPDFWVPPLIGSAILRTSIRGKLQAVAEEIERRAAVKNSAP